MHASYMNQVIVFFTIRKYLACSFVLAILASTASYMEKERKTAKGTHR